MEKLNDKLAIASDGNKTIVILNGRAYVCQSLTLNAEYGQVNLTLENLQLGHAEICEKRSFEMFRELSGYKLSKE